MTRPFYGSNLAPKNSGGTYTLVHCCTGLKITSGWRYTSAMEMAVETNEMQDIYGARGEGFCPRNEICLGVVVFKDPVSGESEA